MSPENIFLPPIKHSSPLENKNLNKIKPVEIKPVDGDKKHSGLYKKNEQKQKKFPKDRKKSKEEIEKDVETANQMLKQKGSKIRVGMFQQGEDDIKIKFMKIIGDGEETVAIKIIDSSDFEDMHIHLQELEGILIDEKV